MIRKNNHSSNRRQHLSLRSLAFAVLLIFNLQFSIFNLLSCSPEPPLHLYDAQEVVLDQPVIDLDLEVYWDYMLDFGFDVKYDWREKWYYGWDDEDRELFGELGYAIPKSFVICRYYTGDVPDAKHTGVIRNEVEGTHFQDRYDWGFWDILVWNRIETLDGVQSLIFDDVYTHLDSVTAHTNQSMIPSRYQAPRYTHSFYQPEPLFAAYDENIEINRNLDGFTYDPERHVYFRQLEMILRPITYIYLTQVILHNNNGRITAVDGSSNLSAMARTTCLNSGRAGDDAITVNYGVRMKRNIPMVPYSETAGVNGTTETEGTATNAEIVDIIGGRLMTFGIPGHRANAISRAGEVHDEHRHYIDLNMQFNNGIDSLFVFDVTDQVRSQYKGGVITVELDMDTVPIPTRKGGSGFNAVVVEPDSVTHVIEM